MSVNSLVSGWIALAFVQACNAQTNTFQLIVSNTVSPATPSATVEIWAVFDPDAYALSEAIFDLSSSPDPGAFSNPVIYDRNGYCDFVLPGDIDPSGDSITGTIASQFHLGGGCFASPDNPYLIMSYTWSTSDFAHRAVDLSTSTDMFRLYVDFNGYEGDFLHDEFGEGAGLINVVPAPGCAAAVACTGALTLRRRRGTS